MQSRSYNFGTAKKRSSLLQSKGIEFPRQDLNAPRMRIVKRQCPPEYDTFVACLQKNAAKPDVCLPLRQKLFECGRPGFKKANTDPDYEY